MKKYPFELSGGMQQRVMIAMALACEPKLLIADEPTTALDVTIQEQILHLIRKLNEKMGMSVLFITHDMGAVSQLCHSVKVMYLGQICRRCRDRGAFFPIRFTHIQKDYCHVFRTWEWKEMWNCLPYMERFRLFRRYQTDAIFSTRCQYADKNVRTTAAAFGRSHFGTFCKMLEIYR